MQSPLPGNEAGRSRVLWNYRILDTPPEERFDDLVRVATYVPRALTGVQTRILWALARQVMAHLEDRRDLGSNPERDSYQRYRRSFASTGAGVFRTSPAPQDAGRYTAALRGRGFVLWGEAIARPPP